MKISGSYTFDAPQDDVWALLMDPDAISQAIPGVEKFHAVGENDYETHLKIGLGAVSGQYTGRVTLSDIDAPTHYHMKIGGKGQRGFVNGEGTITLEPQNGKTVVHYTGDAALGGQLAGVAQRLVEGAARTLINQGFKSLEAQLAARRAAVPAPEAAPAPTPEAAPVPAPEAAPTVPPSAAYPPPPPPPPPVELPSAVPAIPTRWLIAGGLALVLVLWLLLRRR